MTLSPLESSSTASLAIFTICSNNYMAMASVFVESARLHHPEASIYLCLADVKIETENFYPEGCIVVDASELDLPDFHNFVFRYSIMELNTALKPFMFLRLFHEGFSNVLYFDPDIEIYSKLSIILEALNDKASFALTPHLLQPNEGNHYPDDMGIMKAGIYNLGFLGAHHTADTLDVLHWWARRLTYFCISDQANGIFVDQKFMDLVPGFVAKIAIIREPTLNAAYWNLQQRLLEYDGTHFKINGKLLVFFHYSGFSPAKKNVLSKHTNAFRNLDMSPPLQALLEQYADKLIARKMDLAEKQEYSFGRFFSGTPINDHVRKIFRDNYNFWPTNPFETFEMQLRQPIEHQEFKEQTSVITEMVWGLRTQHPSLINQHNLSTAEGRNSILQWFIQSAGSLGIDRRLIEPVAEQYGARQITRKIRDKSVQSDCDVTVVSYLQLTSGVAESGRQLLRSLNHGGKSTASGLAVALNALSPKLDDSCNQWLTDTSDAPIQLFGVNADQLPQVIEHLKSRIKNDAYRIVYPYWELSKFPKEWVDALDSVDEVWAPTRFIQSALSCVTTKPVLRMPLALDFTPPTGKPRSTFSLPDDAFLFYFSFDYMSYIERKNPAAAYAAFQKAFGDKDKYPNVFLVVKSMNSNHVPIAHRALSAALESDPQIIMMNKTLSRDDTLSLLKCIDAVVSLHRGEGLGLLIAEAMVLGKPVISTDYSATTELISPSTGWPVNYNLISIEEGEYPFHLGQKWADPDVEHAAWQMRQVFENDTAVRLRTQAAKKHIAAHYSMSVVSERMRERLNFIKGQ